MSQVITQTTISGAVPVNAQVITVASAANIVAPTNNIAQKLYVINPNHTRGELMTVVAVSGTQVFVSRLDKYKSSIANGAIVLIAPVDPFAGGFYEFNPNGAPLTNPNMQTPWLNIDTGEQWLYSSVALDWVAGWNNPSSIKGVTAAVASAAGAILPSGPLFHVTGALAVTGFTIPLGFAGGSFTIIPDGAFTWTTAGNIGLAGTAVVGRTLVFTWDSGAGKFYPSYV